MSYCSIRLILSAGSADVHTDASALDMLDEREKEAVSMLEELKSQLSFSPQDAPVIPLEQETKLLELAQELISGDSKEQSGVSIVPEMQSFSSVPEFLPSLSISDIWQLWDCGCDTDNLQPVKNFLNSSLRKEDFDAKRFALWERLATYILERAVLRNERPSKVAEYVESVRQDAGVSACNFAQRILPSDFRLVQAYKHSQQDTR